jgi:hypothetical protein
LIGAFYFVFFILSRERQKIAPAFSALPPSLAVVGHRQAFILKRLGQLIGAFYFVFFLYSQGRPFLRLHASTVLESPFASGKISPRQQLLGCSNKLLPCSDVFSALSSSLAVEDHRQAYN